MESFLNKLEEYNILNYLLPGIVFTWLAKKYIGIDASPENIFEMLFIYYFIGSVISRLGSLLLEKILIKIKYIKYADYEDYIEATKKDKLIEKLLISSNTYRTFCAGFISLLALKLLKIIIDYFKISTNIFYAILLMLGAIIYCFSYKKQTQYITRRVERAKDEEINTI